MGYFFKINTIKFVTKTSSDNINYSVPTYLEIELDELEIMDIFILINPEYLNKLSFGTLFSHIKNLSPILHKDQIISYASYMQLCNMVDEKIEIGILISEEGDRILFDMKSDIYKHFKSILNIDMPIKLSSGYLWYLSNLLHVQHMTILDLIIILDQVEQYMSKISSDKLYDIICNKLLNTDDKDIITNPHIVKFWDRLLLHNIELKRKCR